jgi:hypothetical protein
MQGLKIQTKFFLTKCVTWGKEEAFWTLFFKLRCLEAKFLFQRQT